MVRTQIQLTEEQVKALRKIAMTSRLSVAELIRRAIDTMIKSRVTVDPDERLKRALEIVGKFSSGKRDTSRKHDSCLADDLSK
jgi:hypothetical protein